MAIFYTKHEGGIIEKFPKNPHHWWAIEQLEQNVTTSKYLLRSEFTSDIFDNMPLPLTLKCSYLCGIRVHSVFFTKGDELYFVFDASNTERHRNRLAIPTYPKALVVASFKEFIKNNHGKKAINN